MLVQRLPVGAVEDDSLAQLLAQERLEQGKDNVEDLWLIDDMNRLDAQRHAVLQPVNNLQR